MKYLWTEDTGAGLHYWQLMNEYIFRNEYVVESKGSNQGLLDAVRALIPEKEDRYFLAFDLVYDNMDIVNKYLGLPCVKISGQKTREYLMGFKRFSTERVLKAIVNELTENNMWQIKGKLMGDCWYQDCCTAEHPDKKRCGVGTGMSGAEKITELFRDVVTKDLIRSMHGEKNVKE